VLSGALTLGALVAFSSTRSASSGRSTTSPRSTPSAVGEPGRAGVRPAGHRPRCALPTIRSRQAAGQAIRFEDVCSPTTAKPRAARREPGHPARRRPSPCGRHRLRQDHPGAPAGAVLRRDPRAHHLGRGGPAASWIGPACAAASASCSRTCSGSPAPSRTTSTWATGHRPRGVMDRPRVQAEGFIGRLPGGCRPRSTERGTSLSTGERQLLGVRPRAGLRPGGAGCWNEATSSVTPRTEHVIQEVAQALLRGRTSIVIASPASPSSRPTDPGVPPRQAARDWERTRSCWRGRESTAVVQLQYGGRSA